MTAASPLHLHHHTLGEGAFYHVERQQLWWVDIEEKRIYCSDLVGQHLQTWTMPERVGFALPRPDGRFWVGLQSGLHLADLLDGGEARLERLDYLMHPGGEVRFNDAGLGPDGSLYASTMAMDGELPLGTMLYYNAEGNRQTLAENFVIGNGPVYHPQQGLLMVETVGHAGRPKGIYARHPTVPDASETLWLRWKWESSPDGISLDATDNIWVGEYGGHTIRQFSPSAGLLQAIDLPALNPTKIAALPDRRLFVTTAGENVPEEKQRQFPLTGKVLVVTL
jgi:xylono-1,5-lactonase